MASLYDNHPVSWKGGPSALLGSDYEETYFASDAMSCLQDLARCGQCRGRTAPQFDDQGNSLTNEQAATLQWVRCSQCRCGTHDWYRP
jgi:hypothetical protein